MSPEPYLRQYARSHRNPANQRIHLLCVPLIFFATVALAWQVALPWGLNLAVLAAFPVLAFYAWLGLSSLLTGSAWMGLSLAICTLAEGLALPLGWIAGGLWLLAWAAQFYGHYLEGEKPSFSEDLVFLLIGPLYVQRKWLGTPLPLQRAD